MACLDELLRQHVIYQKKYDQKLMGDTKRKLVWEGLRKYVMDGDTMIDKRTDEVLEPEIDFTYWKNKFQRVDFIALVDHNHIP